MFWCCRRRKVQIPIITYDQLYPLCGFASETSENLEAGVVEEITPDGNVRLQLRDGIFEYWSKRAIQFRYLEAVARKYVLVYNCSEKYTHMARILAPTTSHNDAFATFKDYRKHKVANRYTWKGSNWTTQETITARALCYSDFKNKID